MQRIHPRCPEPSAACRIRTDIANTFFAQRGNRELPISREENAGNVNSGPILYPYLRERTASDQGTDWRDNDPQLEPLVEIYQGLNGQRLAGNAQRNC